MVLRGRTRVAESRARVPLIQWIVAGIALAVVLASFGIVAYGALAHGKAPPAFHVAIDSVSKRPDGYHLHFTVVNRGGRTATDVEVRTVGAPGALRFDYLAGGSSASGVFLLPADPGDAGVQVVVTGFREP